MKDTDQSAFIQTALAFDRDLQELERLSRHIDEATLDKESGIERAQKLLGHFGDCGMRVVEELKILGKKMQEAREKAERASALVAEKAALVKQFQDQTQALRDRFAILSDGAKELTERLTQFRQNRPVEDNRAELKQYLPELNSRISALLKEAQNIRDQAKNEHLESLERNAEVLSKNLAAAQTKLNSLAS